MNRRARRWHECLSVLKPDYINERPSLQKEANINHGRRIHELIEENYDPTWRQREGKFEPKDLPFDIYYHPDLYDWRNNIVYEIKPVKWYLKNTAYCIAQLSGYIHFTGARSGQFLFYDGWTTHWPYNPPWLNTWEELRSYALASDQMLIEQARPQQVSGQ